MLEFAGAAVVWGLISVCACCVFGGLLLCACWLGFVVLVCVVFSGLIGIRCGYCLSVVVLGVVGFEVELCGLLDIVWFWLRFVVCC